MITVYRLNELLNNTNIMFDIVTNNKDKMSTIIYSKCINKINIILLNLIKETKSGRL